MKNKVLKFLFLLIFFTHTKSFSQIYDVLADGITYENFSSTVFYLNDSSTDNYKIIRNCTFKNASSGAIWLYEVNHIIVENCTFENISAATGSVENIGIKIADNCDNIIIRNCNFKNIGADAIQLWHFPTNVQILNNEFWVESGIEAENAIDVKSTTGPILIKENNIHGFRPVDNPPLSSSGEGIVIHGVGTGYAQQVYVIGNRIWNNTSGIVCGSDGPQSGSPDKIVFRNNIIYNNLNTGMLISEENGRDVDVSHNTFYNNAINHLYVFGATDDRFSNNLFVGIGDVGANSGAVTTILNNNNLKIADVADAGFVDVYNDDFHLLCDSPAVNSGASTLNSLWTDEGLITDIDNEPRPAGTSADYGADENYGDTLPPVPDVSNLPDITVECELMTLVPPTATDNCSGSISGTTNATLPITTDSVITWTYMDTSGHTSSQTQNVIITPIDNSVTQNGTVLTAVASGYNYQWIDCDTNDPINGETNQSFQVQTDGSYAVIISYDNCSVTSECIQISGLSITNNTFKNSIKIYPNPSTEKFNIQLTNSYPVIKLEVSNLLGQIIISRHFANVKNMNFDIKKNGIYIVSIEKERGFKVFYKLIKR